MPVLERRMTLAQLTKHLEPLIVEYVATRQDERKEDQFATDRQTTRWELEGFLDWLKERPGAIEVDQCSNYPDCSICGPDAAPPLRAPLERLAGCANWKPKHGLGPYCGNCGFHETEHELRRGEPR